MSNESKPFTVEPSSGTIPTVKVRKVLLWVSLTLIVLTLISTNWSWITKSAFDPSDLVETSPGHFERRGKSVSGTTTPIITNITIAPFGTVEIFKGRWTLVVACYDTKYHICVKPDSTMVEAYVDMKTNNVFLLYPDGWDGSKTNVVVSGGLNKVYCKLPDSSPLSRSTVTYTLSPR